MFQLQFKASNRVDGLDASRVVDDSLALSQNYDSRVLEILGNNDFVKLLASHLK